MGTKPLPVRLLSEKYVTPCISSCATMSIAVTGTPPVVRPYTIAPFRLGPNGGAMKNALLRASVPLCTMSLIGRLLPSSPDQLCWRKK